MLGNINNVKDINDLLTKEEVLSLDNIFNEVNLEIQLNKAKNHNLSNEDTDNIINTLRIRPKLLYYLSKYNNCLNVAEVGTAKGLQSLSFSKNKLIENIYTCDIVDYKSSLIDETSNIHFVKGDSSELSKKILDSDKTIDLFWIDGAHDHYSVITDFVNLLKVSHKNSIWVFDDFDNRFGCYYDISVLIKASKEHIIIDLGKTASGNPNRIVICKGLK